MKLFILFSIILVFLSCNVLNIRRNKRRTPAKHNEVCYRSTPDFYQEFGGSRTCEEGLKCLYKKDPGIKSGVSKFCLNPKEDEHYDPSKGKSMRKRRYKF